MSNKRTEIWDVINELLLHEGENERMEDENHKLQLVLTWIYLFWSSSTSLYDKNLAYDSSRFVTHFITRGTRRREHKTSTDFWNLEIETEKSFLGWIKVKIVFSIKWKIFLDNFVPSCNKLTEWKGGSVTEKCQRGRREKEIVFSPWLFLLRFLSLSNFFPGKKENCKLRRGSPYVLSISHFFPLSLHCIFLFNTGFHAERSVSW